MFFTLSLNSICQAQNYCETLINKYDYYLDKTNDLKTSTLTWSDGYLITKQNDTIYGEILKLPDVVTLKEPYKNDYAENNLGLTRIKLRNENIDEKKFKADEVKLFVVDNETYRSIKPKEFSIFVREKIIGSLCLFTSECYSKDMSGDQVQVVNEDEYVYSNDYDKYYRLNYKNMRKVLIEVTKDYKMLNDKLSGEPNTGFNYQAVILLFNDYKVNCN